MARSVSAILVLGLLAVAAFSMGGAAADSKGGEGEGGKGKGGEGEGGKGKGGEGEGGGSKGGLVGANVKVSVSNNCNNNLQMVVGLGVGNMLYCQKGSLAVLGPVVVKVEVLNVLQVQLFVYDNYGNLLNVRALVKIDLGLLGQLVYGVVDLVLDVVEEIVVGVEGKVIKLFCGNVLLGQVAVSL